MGFKVEQGAFMKRGGMLIGLLVFLIVSFIMIGPPFSNHPLGARFRKPTSFELRTLSSLAHSRMRIVSLGLEAYQIDHGHFPPPLPMSGIKTPRMAMPLRLNLTGVMTYPDWETVLFPAAVSNNKLQGKLFKIHDSYTSDAELPFGYYTKNERWVLHAVGEDGVYSLHPASDIDWNAPDWLQEQQRVRITAPVYDPTNGSWSAGDLVRFSGG